MKRIGIVLVFVGITIATACKFGADSDKQSITVRKTDTTYRFKASYPKRKTTEVLNYVERTLKQEQLFGTDGIKDSDVILGDSIKFHLQSEPGFIAIDFKKTDNSFESCQKMESMCIGIKKILQ